MKDLDSHTGGCWCGLVRYESYGEPTYAGICHCRYCQLRTGSAFGVSIYFPDELLKILKGDQHLKSYKMKNNSDRDFEIRFCTNCGTSLFWKVESREGMTAIAGGTFDPPTFWYKPETEVFCRSKCDFVVTDVPNKFDTSPMYSPVNTGEERLGS